MEEIIDQMLAAVAADLIYPALITAVTLPDICAALGATGGQTSSAKYRAWVESNMDSWWGPNEAKDLYSFRCALLHEGASRQIKRGGARFLFVRSQGVIIHKGSHYRTRDSEAEARVMDIPMFCKEMADACRKWLQDQRGTEPFESNYARSIRLHTNGYENIIGGAPVIG